MTSTTECTDVAVEIVWIAVHIYRYYYFTSHRPHILQASARAAPCTPGPHPRNPMQPTCQPPVHGPQTIHAELRQRLHSHSACIAFGSRPHALPARTWTRAASSASLPPTPYSKCHRTFHSLPIYFRAASGATTGIRVLSSRWWQPPAPLGRGVRLALRDDAAAPEVAPTADYPRMLCRCRPALARSPHALTAVTIHIGSPREGCGLMSALLTCAQPPRGPK